MTPFSRPQEFLIALLSMTLVGAADPILAVEVVRDVPVSGGQTGTQKQGVGFGHLTKPAHVLTLNLNAPEGREVVDTAVSGSGMALWGFEGGVGHTAVPAKSHKWTVVGTAGDFEDVGHSVLFDGKIVGGSGDGYGSSQFEVAVAQINLLADGVDANKEHEDDVSANEVVGLVTGGDKKEITVVVRSKAEGKIKLTGTNGVMLSNTENGVYAAALDDKDHNGSPAKSGKTEQLEQQFTIWVQADGEAMGAVVATFEPTNSSASEPVAIDKLAVTGDATYYEIVLLIPNYIAEGENETPGAFIAVNSGFQEGNNQPRP